MSSRNTPEPPARKPWSLAARLTAWYTASAFLLLLGTSAFLYWVLVSNLDREDDQFLAERAQFLCGFLRDRPNDLQALRQLIVGEATPRPFSEIGVRLLDEQGHTLLETRGLSADLAPDAFPTPVAEGGPRQGTEVETPAGKSFRLLAVRVERPSRILQLAFDRTHEENLLAGYRRGLWLLLGLAVVLCAAVGHQIARRGLRPLVEITGAAQRVRSTTLHERLQVDGLPAEVAILADTFNDMLDRLEESFHRLARFSADIAHELRTPVNNLRGEAEVALGQPRTLEEYRDVLGSSLEECGRLARLIDSLLFLARAEGTKLPLATEAVAVKRELGAVRDFYEAAAGEAGITLHVTAADVIADLDRTLFQRAIGNLLANALAHTPAGGTITLCATAEDDCLKIDVADTGEGIPAEHLPHVFDRFYRADPARTSTSGRVGLGLAIVKSIAELHRGTVAIASTVGRGTRVALSFPLRARPAVPTHLTISSENAPRRR